MPRFTPLSNVPGVVEEVADHSMASVAHVQQWEWLVLRFNTRQYVEYSLVNLDQVPQHEAYFVWVVEQILIIYIICLNLVITLCSVWKLSACVAV